jgi:sec-independent protein translocase protein TatB
MFDIAPSEMLLTAIVAIVVIGPKDMPLALRTAGRWIGKMRRMSNHVRSGFEAMIHEAEMEEMNRKWREQNEAIMLAHPMPPEGLTLPPADPGTVVEGTSAEQPGATAEHAGASAEGGEHHAPQSPPPVLP